MIYAFETRRLTDNVIGPFAESVEGKLIKSRGQVLPEERTQWPNFNIQKWVSEKTPIAIFGILRGTAELMRICKEHNIDYYYFDHAYFYRADRHKNHMAFNTRFYRITKNGQSLNKIIEWNKSEEYANRIKVFRRTFNIKVNTKFFQSEGEKILVLPPSDYICKFYNYGTQEDWINKTVKKIEEHTDRKIIIRRKGDKENFIEQLQSAYCTVSSQTTAIIDSIRFGKPSFCEEMSCALPMSKTDLSEIENPFRPKEDEIEYWINGLLSSQFKQSEISSGYAFKMIEDLQ